jgi:phosphoserine phosphatase
MKQAMGMNTGIEGSPRAASIAFFDLDGTILRRDSDLAWALFWASRGRMRASRALELLALSIGYSNGGMKSEAYSRFLRKRMIECGSEYEAMADVFFLKAGKRMIRPSMAELIWKYREAHISTAIVSAQERTIASRFAADVGTELLAASDLAPSDDEGTRASICFGEEKVARASAMAKKLCAKLRDCAFYGDSIYDAPLLSSVGWPVAVNPDRRLERLARSKGWSILIV